VAVRRRLDAELVRRELAHSRAVAQQLIEADRVLVNGAVAAKASRQVSPADAIVIDGPPSRFVGRGAAKLEHALIEFDIDVSGLRLLDAGASTGGFTDCLLQRGAQEVVAVDVGHGQLHERLRADRRVVNVERQNVRNITADILGGVVDGAVGDLSFISLRLVIAPIISVCQPGGFMVFLVKPQFEAGRAEVSKGRGIVSDPVIHERVRREIDAALRASRCRVVAWTSSPIAGADGNVEFLVHATTPDFADRSAGYHEVHRESTTQDPTS
jgi:23S rRNA (cytidine1920-2'-O)/16S rRNA (cytidine1409-2'-O)-methyltransferase